MKDQRNKPGRSDACINPIALDLVLDPVERKLGPEEVKQVLGHVAGDEGLEVEQVQVSLVTDGPAGSRWQRWQLLTNGRRESRDGERVGGMSGEGLLLGDKKR